MNFKRLQEATTETLEEKIARLEKENLQLKANNGSTGEITFKIGDKGGISVYGLGGRFPLTLYKNQWLLLLQDKTIASLLEFIKLNDSKLSNKK